MTKHLKLKVKNTQLAAALQLSRKKKEDKLAAEKKAKAPPKKPTASKKEAAKKEAPSGEKPELAEQSLPPSSSPSKQEEKPAASPVEKPKETPVKKQTPPPKKEPIKQSFETLKKRQNLTPAKAEEGFRAQVSRKKGKEVKPKPNPFERKPFDARDRQGLRVGEEQVWRRRKPRHRSMPKQHIEIVRPKNLSVRLPISIKDLAQAMKLKASELLSKLFLQGIKLTLNDHLDDETTIQLLGQEFGCEIAIDTTEEKRLRVTDKTIAAEIAETPTESLTPRSPVIAFMGHVDHGKTSLIDAIRKSNLATHEAGAITQHIGAFRCHRKQGDITILDTPGHEAFTLMRQRGAALTDLIVLVIAGDEGIMPQTDEAIEQAKAAGVPLLIALNKSDKPGFNVDNIYRQLADRELLPESWGGDVVTVNCSATTSEGIPELLEMLTLQSELLELKANKETRARGTVIESQLHKGFGAVATVLVQNGTLKLGDAIIFEDVYARIKTMHDEHGKTVAEAGPSCPVKITGLSGVPHAGCEFIAVKNEKEARKLCAERASGVKRSQIKRPAVEGFEALLKKHQEQSETKTLNLIIRADVQGSIEAIKTSLRGIKTEKVALNFISADVGEISESDIELAAASQAVIIGFHTHIESHADHLVKRSGVLIKMRTIIYQLVDDVKELMLQQLDKIRQENQVGSAEVKQIFKSSHLGIIAGCQVVDGIIKRNHHVKVMREGALVWSGEISSLKRVKEDVKEVSKGLECGILLERFNDVQPGDMINAFEVTYINQEL